MSVPAYDIYTYEPRRTIFHLNHYGNSKFDLGDFHESESTTSRKRTGSISLWWTNSTSHLLTLVEKSPSVAFANHAVSVANIHQRKTFA